MIKWTKKDVIEHFKELKSPLQKQGNGLNQLSKLKQAILNSLLR